MLQRNWLELSRKLVDRTDFDYTLQGMSKILGEYALSFFGEGVLATTQFPNPFPIVLSTTLFGGTVGPGIAYDPKGNYTSIPSGTGAFNISTSDSSNARWDLLVLRYKQVGDTLIPKPSDPLTMVYLNLLDSFELAVVPGVPGAFPSYPSKGTNDIILAGVRVPANSTIGTQCTLDLSIREVGVADVVKYPVFRQEQLIGTVNGVNTVFTISDVPISGSLALFGNGLIDKSLTEWTISGTTITFATAPEVGQLVYAWYIVMDSSSTNPMAVNQENPNGLINGINDTFSLLGTPANKVSTMVFVDGIFSFSNEWSLIQTPTGTSIKFLPGSIPQTGQSVYCMYFVNPATVGIAPSSGGSGGGGALTPYGSMATPLLIDPSVGVSANSVPRQLQFIKSLGGEVIVTANPQISPGTTIGEELILKGVSDTDYIVLNDGNGLSLNGTCNLTLNETLPMFWDGSNWCELSRRL